MTAELALTKPDPTLDMGSLRVMMEAAQRYVASGLLPSEVNTPQKALVIMKAGRELGIPDTYALRNIHVVKGKPSCSSELLLALVRRTYGPSAIRVGKTTNTECTVQYREQGWDGVSEYTFTIEDAKQAKLTNNPTWTNYPAAMLRARCISAVVRFAFPEAIAGLYTPEELGAEVEVNDQGEVVKVSAVEPTPLRAVTGEVVEPTEEESARAREIVGGNPMLRAQAHIRYQQLAQVAVDRKHKKASEIKGRDLDAMDDATLAAAVKWLEEQFPDVPEPDYAAEAAGEVAF